MHYHGILMIRQNFGDFRQCSTTGLFPEAVNNMFFGRYSDLPLPERLPIVRQWHSVPETDETYSSGYCTGFTPVSLR